MNNGFESHIAFGRGNRPSHSKLFRIGGKLNIFFHGLTSFFFDRHGLGSARSTKKLLRMIDSLKPDIVVLHNLHGYYVNYELLLKYLGQINIPVVWTLYDCWAFTGHCAYFDDINCLKWKSICNKCPKIHNYPKSIFLDNSMQNFLLKKEVYGPEINLSLIVHSNWLKQLVHQSILKQYPVTLIRTGVDLHVFKPIESDIKIRLGCSDSKMILGCASTWDERKGLRDFKLLSELLPSNYQIVLVGLSNNQKKGLPENIIAISRTESVEELAKLYSAAHVFVNPTWQDNFPTTNLEALACGTPVITYNTGGSPEAIDATTGIVVPKGNVKALADAIEVIVNDGKEKYAAICRQRAVKYFNKEVQYQLYVDSFNNLLNNNK